MNHDNSAFQPMSGMVQPRFAGIATFMRLPHVLPEAAKGSVEIGLIGLPWDNGTTNRSGTRHGPRQLREQSTLMRQVHHVSKIEPFKLANCADLGDVTINPVDLMDTIKRIETYYKDIHSAGIVPLTAGGDHLLSLPVLRGIAHQRPVGMVHIDAHTDTGDSYFGDNFYTHGTPFRRAIEDGVLDSKRMVQIGIRGTLYSADDREWGLSQGIRIIEIEHVHDLGLPAVIEETKAIIGDGPTYLSFDIDSLDPVYAPGTGTPEVGGLTMIEAQRLVRGLRGVDFIGADLVEVSPPFDPSGLTALAGASMMFEMLCLLAERVAKRRAA